MMPVQPMKKELLQTNTEALCLQFIFFKFILGKTTNF